MPRGMTADDLFRIQWVSDARLSPDGRTVAFTVTRLDQEADDYRSTIWTVRSDGGDEPRQLTTGKGKDNSPRWSPDGSHLAFLSDRDGGKSQVHLIDAAGGEARRLTDIKQGAGAPVWSPDGRRLVCVVRTGGDDEQEKDGKPKTKPARVITMLKQRMNAEGWTYDRRRHLFIVDAATGETRQLTDGDWDDIQPAWSPDSRRITFVSARHESRERDRSEDLWVVDADGGEPVQVTPGGGSVALPAWSPDGQSIAYMGFADAEDPPRNSRLWLTPATGGAPRCLTANLDRNLEASETAAPVWAADGASILTGIQERGTVGVVRVAVAGGSVERLVAGQRSINNYDPRGDAIAFVASGPARPAEVFIRDAGGERQLTDLNAAWRSEVELVEPEHFTVSSPAGEVDCWVMRPAGFEPGKKYPALLNIHGGPFVQYGYTFLDEFQVQAGAGYVVVYSNPRGSSGQEEDFARALIGSPAEPMTEDVLAAMDEALRRYDFIDPERTGVLGGSYGGYITGWIIGHTDRFAAACAERGIYNRYSRELTGDIPTAFTYLGVRPWEEPETYWRWSPIAFVKEMRTPVLIVHSEEDLRCPIEQAEQLFAALKRLGRDTRFIRFPGENHELSRAGKPSHRLQRFEHMLGWFAEKLAGVREGVAAG
jgi:dipeptidyl aminopeptidase/acylaminoacyl peptidase